MRSQKKKKKELQFGEELTCDLRGIFVDVTKSIIVTKEGMGDREYKKVKA